MLQFAEVPCYMLVNSLGGLLHAVKDLFIEIHHTCFLHCITNKGISWLILAGFSEEMNCMSLCIFMHHFWLYQIIPPLQKIPFYTCTKVNTFLSEQDEFVFISVDQNL